MLDKVNLAPRVTDYSDYHRFLRDFYDHKKAQNRHFSFRKFSHLAKIKSSNFLLLVMERKRKLSVATARDVAQAMRLTKSETEFFVALVKAGAARTKEELEQIEGEKRRAVKKIIARDLPAEKAEYLSVWYYSLVRELAFLPGFKPSAQWISGKLAGLISEEQAESAIRVLVKLGLWKMGDDGRVKVSDVFLDTGSDERTFGDVSTVEIHKQNMLAWTRVLDRTPRQDRELGLLHIPMRKEHVPELKARIQKFQDEIIGWLQDEKEPTVVVQLGTYLIPVTGE